MSVPLNLIPDAPITNPSFDRLDRMAFVRSFAEAIRAAKGETSVVLALAGAWGSGKSSLLNLIAGELKDTETEKAPLIVRFNPWWFTETKQLIAAFLQQLGAATSRPEVSDVLGDAALALDQLADSLAAPGVNQSQRYESRDIQIVREKVVEVFRKSDRRILILMDDIDRLSPEEMSQLLLIVRAIADFPHTTYVLSLDYDVVVQAMENKLGVDGRTYLEKVIQLQIDVPLPARLSLERLVIGQLAEIDPEARGLNPESQRKFQMIFEGGIKHFLATPRACTRFLNVIRFIYPTVKGQIFLPDLLGLSALMAFSSQAIQAIRSFQDAFVGSCDEKGKGWVELSQFHIKWLGKVAERDRPFVEAIVRLMFPKVAWALNGPCLGEEFVEEWNQRKRICSVRHFDTYFRLGLSAGEASEYKWRNLVELLDDATSFAKALNQFGPLGEEKAESWLLDLLQQASEFVSHKADSEQATRMFQALIKRGDQVDIVKEDGIGWLIDPIHRVVAVLVECLQRIPSPSERLDVVGDSISNDAGLLTAIQLLELLEHRIDLFADPDKPLDAATRETLLGQVVEGFEKRLDSACQDDSLATHPRMIWIIDKWRKYGRAEKVNRWIGEKCRTDQGLIEVLLAIAEEKTLLSESERKRKTEIPLEFIQRQFNSKQLLQRIQSVFKAEPEWNSISGQILLSSLIDLLPQSR